MSIIRKCCSHAFISRRRSAFCNLTWALAFFSGVIMAAYSTTLLFSPPFVLDSDTGNDDWAWSYSIFSSSNRRVQPRSSSLSTNDVQDEAADSKSGGAPPAVQVQAKHPQSSGQLLKTDSSRGSSSSSMEDQQSTDSCRCVLESSSCRRLASSSSLVGSTLDFDSIFWRLPSQKENGAVNITPHEIPLLQPSHCKLRQYRGEEVRKCIEGRSQGRTAGRSFLFIGDSRVRDIFTAFLNVTRVLEYTVNYETDLWAPLTKYLYPTPKRPHQRVQAQSKLKGAPVKVMYWWAPWLGPHAKHQINGVLQTMKSHGGKYRKMAPAFVVVGFGAWATTAVNPNRMNQTIADEEEWRILDKYKKALRDVADPLMQLSFELPVLWSLPFPSGKTIKPSAIKSKSKWVNPVEFRNRLGYKLVTATREMLEGSKVILWDTSWAIHKAHVLECQARKMNRKRATNFISPMREEVELDFSMSTTGTSAPNSGDSRNEGKEVSPLPSGEWRWRCNDDIHLGYDALNKLAQNLVNFSCNRFLNNSLVPSVVSTQETHGLRNSTSLSQEPAPLGTCCA